MSISEKQLTARRAKNAFIEPYIAELAPVGAVETQLAETIATDAWLIRIRAVSFEHFTDATLGLCELRITRNIHRNMKLLCELQDRRKRQEKALLQAEAKQLAPANPRLCHNFRAKWVRFFE